MKVKIKTINGLGTIPSYAKEGDAGMDLTATSLKIVEEGRHGYYEYGTDLQMEIPEGYMGLIFPRSSISNTGHIQANSVGVVDSGFRGEIKVRFKTIPDTTVYAVGERVAQLIIVPYPQIEWEVAEELTASKRGNTGFGSTGLN